MPADAALAEATDPAVLRAERRLRVLEEVTEICMDLARLLQRQAHAAAEAIDSTTPAAPDAAEASAGRAPAPIISAGDIANALARISRAIRLTVALETRTEEALRALRAGVTAEVEAGRVATRYRAAAEAEARSRSHRDTVERLVSEAAEREIEDDETLNGVLEALEERLDEDEAYWDLDRMPLREAVERLCADLELTPDWSLWEGEGWPPNPPFSRPKGSIWALPSRRPLLEPAAGSHHAGVRSATSPRLE